MSERLLERDSVLEILMSAASKLTSGEGGVVAVSGEAGIGKTAVLREFADRIGNVCEVLRGGCEDLSTPRLLGPLFDISDALDPEIVAVLADEQRHGHVFGLILAMFRKRSKPVILIIEDVHWADHITLDLIRFLGRRARDLPVLIVISYRDAEPVDAFSIARVLGSIDAKHVERIELKPLSREAIERLAKGSGHDASDIQAVTGGNPFFVTEILAHGDEGKTGLPLSVRDAVWTRVERCSAQQRSILEALSIVPGGSPRELLRHLCPTAAVGEIDRLVAAGMLMDDGQSLHFRHELARQAMLQLLPDGYRRALHGAAEKWLAESPSKNELTAVVQRIHHANAAGNASILVELVPLAAKRAARMGAHKQAAQLLALALPHADTLPTADAALLYENWSHEAGLAEQIDEASINARRKAIELWTALGRTDKVGHNLLWLSRYLWYLGRAEESEATAERALTALEARDPGPELAWSYSFRSQFAMLNDRFAESIAWGEKAVELAARLGEHEVHMHALNNVGSSLMLSGQARRGAELLVQSLDLALAHDEHVQAARAYTNLSENAIMIGDLETAQRYLDEGIIFDSEHDLDSWLHYLRGCKARHLMMQGQLRQSATLAQDVLSLPNQTLVMRLPAATVLAHLAIRLDPAPAVETLGQVLDHALGTKEPQRIAPVRIALAEAAWLADDFASVRRQVDDAFSAGHAVQAWHVGELCCWAYRAGLPISPLPEGLPEAVVLECEGRAEEAASAYAKLGLPFEQAMALLDVAGEGRAASFERAIAIFLSIGATRTADRARQIAAAEQLRLRASRKRRGTYRAARAHPAGLTAKEQAVLRLLSEGASNAAIADHLSRSVRTVEHHVSAVLAKLDVSSRSEVISKLNQRPELIGNG